MSQLDTPDHDILIGMRAEFRAKLDSIESEIKNLRDNTSTTLADHEVRIRSTESWQWKAIGIATTIGAGITLLVTYFAGK